MAGDESQPRIEDPFVLTGDDGIDVVGTLIDGGHDTGVVLVHGVLCDRRMGQIGRVATALSAEHDTLAIDVRGHGDSPGRFSWGRDEWRQVHAAVECLAKKGKRVGVVGFSFGGYHAAKSASRGAPIDRLALVGAPVDMGVLDHWPLNRHLWRHLPPMLRRRRRMVRLAWPAGLTRKALSADDLARVTARTLVVHGTDDWLITRRHAERYADLIPGAELCEIAGGFHAEFLMDSSPGVLLETLRRFFKR